MPSTNITTEHGLLNVYYTFLASGGLEYRLDNACELGLPNNGVTKLGSGFHCPGANSTDKEILEGLLLEEIISLLISHEEIN